MTFSDIFKSSFLENVTSVSLLDMALAVFEEAYTFEEGGIEPYVEL